MKKVYVAGAMSADNILEVLNNIHDGIKIGAELLKNGFAPFVPHLDVMFKIQNGSDLKVPVDNYYQYSMEFLKVCDCVLVCPNWKNSKGTLAEIEMAKNLGIPVYYSLEELLCVDFVQHNLYTDRDDLLDVLEKKFPKASLEFTPQGCVLKIGSIKVFTKNLEIV